MNDMSILTTTLNDFTNVLVQIPSNLKNAAMGLACSLTIIDLLWTYYKEVLEMDWIKYLVRKALTVGLLIWLISSYPSLINNVKEGFYKVSDLAIPSSSTSLYFDNPSELMNVIMGISFDIWDAGSGIAGTILNGIIAIICLAAGAVACFQIIVAFIEFYLLCGLSLIFIPFGAIGVGQQYFSTVFKTIVSCSIKLTVIRLILSLSSGLFSSMSSLTTFKFEQACVAGVTVALIAYLLLSTPKMASGLLTGSASLDGTNVAKMVAGAVKTAGMIGAAAVAGAVAGGVNGAKSGASNASSGIGKALTGLAGAVGGATSGAAVGAGNEIKHNIFGGSANGTIERGVQGGSLFSNAGKKENSGTNEKNNSSSNNNNNDSNKKQESEDSKSNKTASSQNESNNSNSTTSNSNLSGGAVNQNNASIFNGKDGVKGEQGIKGSDGKEGSHGENGITGEQGRTGDTGSSGVQGEKGEGGDNKSIYNSNFSDVNTTNTQTDNTESTSFKRNKDLDDEDK